jgi:methionyl-tRNA synthetase
VAERFYLTTAIDYSNGEPHIGHAFEKIGADAIARYRRLRGDRVRFVIGMDEHGQNVVQAAERAGLEPAAWVDRLAETFQRAWRELAISHDDFIRTTQPRHRRTVEALLRRILDHGYISPGTYAGYYCVGCEAFKLDKDLEDGRCPLHPTREIKWLEEPNYFFALGRFRDALLRHYDRHPDFVQPRSKLHELRNVVAGWSDDYQLSISRARIPWGIPWPDDPSHTVYVWFDALINYLSATGYPDPSYREWWPANLHIIGPDIVRFHAAIWPAMLLAAGLDLPQQVWCHGWINWGGARFSKSAGVAVTLEEAISRHGPDALRYFLLREIPWNADGDFTWERFDARYQADLANGYGNLASRVLAMTARYLDGSIPEAGESTPLDRAGEELIAQYRDAMDRHLLHEGARLAWALVDRANAYVEETAPWNLAKEHRTEALQSALAALCRALARITLLASPYLPVKAGEVWAALGMETPVSQARWGEVERPPTALRRVHRVAPLFPKPGSSAVSA